MKEKRSFFEMIFGFPYKTEEKSMQSVKLLNGYTNMYYTYNNAFVDVRRNRKGGIEGLYPLEFSTVELVKPTVGKPELFVRFTFMNGERVTRPYTDIIHIRRYYNRDEFYGDRNEKIMLDDINVLSAVNVEYYSGSQHSVRKTKKGLGKSSLTPMRTPAMAAV